MYSIGIVEKEFVIPPAITAENMDKLLAALEKRKRPRYLIITRTMTSTILERRIIRMSF